MSVVATIDRALLAQRLTIPEAAEKANVSTRTFYKVRRGDPTVTRDSVSDVAQALGLEPVDLWDAIKAPLATAIKDAA